MTNPFPHGWTLTRVAEIFSAHGGGTPSRSNSSLWNGSIPWLSSGDIKSDIVSEATETITEAGLAESSARLCRPGSVLVVVRSGILKHTLPVAITSRRAAINQDIKCFDSGNNDLNRWLAIALRASERVLLAENREGTTVQSVKFETLQNFSLAIPPLPEQRRIVAKLEKLLDKVNSCQKRLAKIPILLKRFRQAVLAAACSGQLTADWREQRIEQESSEPIATIRSERLHWWNSSRKKPISQGARRHGTPGVYREPAYLNEAETSELAALPKSWAWVALDELSSGFAYGTSSKSSKKGGIPVLRMGNLQNGEIDWSDLAFTNNPVEITKYQLSSNTVLFNRTNSPELVGKTSIYRGNQKAIFAGYLIKIENLPTLDPEYLNYVLNSPYARAWCWSVNPMGSVSRTLMPVS